jgi:hypothetical protein
MPYLWDTSVSEEISCYLTRDHPRSAGHAYAKVLMRFFNALPQDLLWKKNSIAHMHPDRQ